MIWHIFKKDWKLVWFLVAAVAALDAAGEFMYFKLGLFGENPTYELLAQTLPIFAIFGNMFLIAAIVHLDAIPGERQDWLVRPIRRRDLLLEKFIFAVVTVEGPIFLLNMFQGLANGFSIRACLLASLSRVIFLLFFVVLPIFALAAVTRNMTEAFIFGCGCTFIIGAFLTLEDYLNGLAHGTFISIPHSGIGWIGEVFRFGLVALAAAVVLGLQYFRRKTLTSRGLVLAFGLGILLSVFLPWKPAFAIESRLSPDPAAGNAVALAFDAQAGRYSAPSGVDARANERGQDDNAQIFLPLRIAGLPANTHLRADRVEVLLFDADGRAVYHGVGGEFARSSSDPAHVPAYQEFGLPESFYRANQDRPLRVEFDYSLTQFGLSKSYAIAALGGDERMPGWGWCRTEVNERGTAVELHCMQPGHGPVCGSVFLEDASTGARNPEQSACFSDYTPFGDRPLPDNFARFGVNVPFRDPSGLAKFPVDGPRLPQSRVVIRVYEPQDHFTRALLGPAIRLKDWAAQ